MRRNRTLAMSAGIAVAAAMSAGIISRQRANEIVDDLAEPMMVTPPAAEPAAADAERLRIAEIRRARKVARQAKGFASGTHDGASPKTSEGLAA